MNIVESYTSMFFEKRQKIKNVRVEKMQFSRGIVIYYVSYKEKTIINLAATANTCKAASTIFAN